MNIILNIEGHMCICSKEQIVIVDSNQIPIVDIPRFINILDKSIKNNNRLSYDESRDNWIIKWRFYNRLYKYELLRPYIHDIELKNHESIIKLFVYKLFGK